MTNKGRPPKAQGETLARLSKRMKELDNSYHRLGKILVCLENELVGNKHEERIKFVEETCHIYAQSMERLKTASNTCFQSVEAQLTESDTHPKRITELENYTNALSTFNKNSLTFQEDTNEGFCKRISALEEHIKYIINDVVNMFDKLKSPRIMKIEEVEELTTLKRLTIWREEKQGRFPKHRQLTNKSIGWISSEIEDWIATHSSITGSCNLHKEQK